MHDGLTRFVSVPGNPSILATCSILVMITSISEALPLAVNCAKSTWATWVAGVTAWPSSTRISKVLLAIDGVNTHVQQNLAAGSAIPQCMFRGKNRRDGSCCWCKDRPIVWKTKYLSPIIFCENTGSLDALIDFVVPGCYCV